MLLSLRYIQTLFITLVQKLLSSRVDKRSGGINFYREVAKLNLSAIFVMSECVDRYNNVCLCVCVCTKKISELELNIYSASTDY